MRWKTYAEYVTDSCDGLPEIYAGYRIEKPEDVECARVELRALMDAAKWIREAAEILGSKLLEFDLTHEVEP